MGKNETLTLGQFLNKVLAGTAQGTIVALIPNAVLSAILNYFSSYKFITTVIDATVMLQIATPLIMGSLIASQFSLEATKVMMVGGAAFIGSGVLKRQLEVTGFVGTGTGDVINIMITSAIAVLMLIWISDKLGSVSIIALPIIVSVGAGVFGRLIYPYVTQITITIGNLINNFTELQPVAMSMLIGMSFSMLIISPVTTVGIGLAIQLNGVSAGAAAMGVAATTIVLIVNSWKVNESGVTLAIALGGMKMMMPNLFKYPVILIPTLFTAMISSIAVALLSISGTPQSAGFGLVGLVGPLASFDAGLNFFVVIICWIIIPLGASLFSKLVFEKLLNLYAANVVFYYQR